MTLAFKCFVYIIFAFKNEGFDPATGIFEHYAHQPDNANSLSNANIHALHFDAQGGPQGRGRLWNEGLRTLARGNLLTTPP